MCILKQVASKKKKKHSHSHSHVHVLFGFDCASYKQKTETHTTHSTRTQKHTQGNMNATVVFFALALHDRSHLHAYAYRPYHPNMKENTGYLLLGFALFSLFFFIFVITVVDLNCLHSLLDEIEDGLSVELCRVFKRQVFFITFGFVLLQLLRFRLTVDGGAFLQTQTYKDLNPGGDKTV